MARPKKPNEEKRVQVNVRLLPSDKDRLEVMAGESGKPLAAEAEAIIAQHLRRSAETNALLLHIGEQIVELEKRTLGKWHKNLTAWAAVSEMLAHIIDDNRPERISDDDVVMEVRERLQTSEARRLLSIQKLSDLGISVKVDPRPLPLLGASQGRRGLFGKIRATPPPSSRNWEKAAINAMPEGDDKNEAQKLFSEILKLDQVIADIEDEEDEAMRPYIEAEQAGRRIVRPFNSLLALQALRSNRVITQTGASEGSLGKLLNNIILPPHEIETGED